MRPRHLTTVALLVLGLAAVACEPQKPGLSTDGLVKAPAVVAPTVPATPGTWRATAEGWVRVELYPKVLGRAPAAQNVLAWGDRAARTSPAAVAGTFGTTAEARVQTVRYLFDRLLGRVPSASEATYWSGKLGTGWTGDRIVAFLAGSGEFTRAHPSNSAWVKAVFTRLLGRTADAGAVAYYGGRLAGGESRASVAGSIQTSAEARRRVVAVHYADVVGGSLTTDRRTFYVARLAGYAGDESRLRADLVLFFAPGVIRTGVVGDSVAWDLAAHVAGAPLPSIVGGKPLRNAAALGCGVFAPKAGYLYRYSDGTWYSPGDDWCVKNLPGIERDVLGQGVDVLVWPLGGWEQGDVRQPDGSILLARTTAMRNALVGVIVSRIDGYRLRGVDRVLFPELACIRQTGVLGTTTYATFIRSVLDGVVAQRPALAAIAATSPQVCIGGDPLGTSTLDHAVARDDDGLHWRKGAVGAAWAWNAWLAPAIANLTGVTS